MLCSIAAFSTAKMIIMRDACVKLNDFRNFVKNNKPHNKGSQKNGFVMRLYSTATRISSKLAAVFCLKLREC